jgi:hypothetical protein
LILLEEAPLAILETEVAMAKRLVIFAMLSLVLGTIVDASTAWSFQLTAAGRLTIMREAGLELGQCDLNFLSAKEVNEIEDICGTPGTIDAPADTECRISASVSPSPEGDSDLYKVIEVLTVDKRAK